MNLADDIIDWTYNESFIYLVYEQKKLVKCDYTRNSSQEIELQIEPTSIFCDETYLYVGDFYGQIRLYDPNTLLEVKEVDVTDFKGPSRREITQFSSTHHHLFCNSVENGVIIFRKPTILSYKWILIDGSETFTSFAIHENQVFVLTKLGEVYFLDFSVQKLIEIDPFIMSLSYIDLEYDGKYLYLATDRVIKIYTIHPSYELENSIKYEKKISHLLKLHDELVIVFQDGDLYTMKDKIGSINSKSKASVVWKYKFNSHIQSQNAIKLFELVDNHKLIEYDLTK